MLGGEREGECRDRGHYVRPTRHRLQEEGQGAIACVGRCLSASSLASEADQEMALLTILLREAITNKERKLPLAALHDIIIDTNDLTRRRFAGDDVEGFGLLRVLP